MNGRENRRQSREIGEIAQVYARMKFLSAVVKRVFSCHRLPSVIIVVSPAWAIFPYWNFDALCRKAFAQGCTFNHTGEFLGAKDMEDFRKGRCKNWCVPGIQRGGRTRLCVIADIDKVHLEPEQRLSKLLNQAQVEVKGTRRSSWCSYLPE